MLAGGAASVVALRHNTPKPTSLVLFVLRAGKQAHLAFAGWPTECTLRPSNREADWSVSWVMAVLMAVLDLIHKDREDGSAGGPS